MIPDWLGADPLIPELPCSPNSIVAVLFVSSSAPLPLIASFELCAVGTARLFAHDVEERGRGRNVEADGVGSIPYFLGKILTVADRALALIIGLRYELVEYFARYAASMRSLIGRSISSKETSLVMPAVRIRPAF